MNQEIHNKNSAHKYKKTVYRQSRTVIYKCVLPGCTHFILPELILGRKSICWRCGDEHIITEVLAKQVCEDCRKLRRKKKEIKDETLDRIMSIIGGN